MSFKPIDSRRDEFRKYLERSGVVDELTKVLIKLFNTPDRPENAIEFLFQNLGHTLLHKDQNEYLKQQLEDSRNEIAELKRDIEKLKSEKFIIQNQMEQKFCAPDVAIKQEPIEEESSEDEILKRKNTINHQNSVKSNTDAEKEVQEEIVTTSKIEPNSTSPIKTKEDKSNSIEVKEDLINNIKENKNETLTMTETLTEASPAEKNENQEVSSTSLNEDAGTPKPKSEISEIKENLESITTSDANEKVKEEETNQENKDAKTEVEKK